MNLSVLLRPERPLAEAGMFALLAGIVVAEVLEELAAVAVTLKWPNDVLLGGAKLAGVLIDAAPAADKINWLVAGIGINLREAPRIEGRETVALAARGTVLAPALVAEGVLRHLGQWQNAAGSAIMAAWLERAHPVGTPIKVRAGGRTLCGSFVGLAPTGELLLRRENCIEAISTGEVLLGPS